jgi:hypothetical protein
MLSEKKEKTNVIYTNHEHFFYQPPKVIALLQLFSLLQISTTFNHHKKNIKIN